MHCDNDQSLVRCKHIFGHFDRSDSVAEKSQQVEKIKRMRLLDYARSDQSLVDCKHYIVTSTVVERSNQVMIIQG